MPPLLTQLKKCKRHMTTTKVLKKGGVMHALYVTHAVRVAHAQSGSQISPLTHPARASPPFWPKGQPKFRLLGGGELWFGPFQNAFLHSLLGAMFN